MLDEAAALAPHEVLERSIASVVNRMQKKGKGVGQVSYAKMLKLETGSPELNAKSKNEVSPGEGQGKKETTSKAGKQKGGRGKSNYGWKPVPPKGGGKGKKSGSKGGGKNKGKGKGKLPMKGK